MKIGELYAELSLHTGEFKKSFESISGMLDTLSKKAQRAYGLSTGGNTLQRSLQQLATSAQATTAQVLQANKKMQQSIGQTKKKFALSEQEIKAFDELLAKLPPGPTGSPEAVSTAKKVTAPAAQSAPAAPTSAPASSSAATITNAMVQATQATEGLATSINKPVSALQRMTAMVRSAGDAITDWALKPSALLGDVETKVKSTGKAIQEEAKKTEAAVKQASEGSKKATKNAAQDAQDNVKRATWAIRGYIKDTSKIVTGILISQGFYKLLNVIEDNLSGVFEFQKALETASVSFETLMGNAKDAQAYMGALQNFSIDAPGFGMEDLTKQSRRLMAYGFEAQQVIPVLRSLTDWAAATGTGADGLDRISLAMGQILTKGRVMQQELNQLTEAGVPAVAILEEKLGLTKKQLQNIGKQGIPAAEAIPILLQYMEEKAGGTAKRISGTMTGLMEQFKELRNILGSIIMAGPFQKLEKWLAGVVNRLKELVAIGREQGTTGLFNAIFGPKLETSVRLIAASFIRLYESLQRIWAVIGPVFKKAFTDVVQVLGMVLPVIAEIASVLAYLIEVIFQVLNPIKGLVAAIGSLAVAAVTFTFLQKLAIACKGLFIMAPLTKVVLLFKDAIQALGIVMARNPWIAIGSIIVATLLSIALSIESVNAAIGRFMQRIAALLGFNLKGITSGAQVDMKKLNEAMKGYSGSLGDVAAGLGGVGDAAGDAADKQKQLNDNLQSFDEVHQIEEDKGDIGSGGGIGDVGGISDIAIPDFDFNDLIDESKKAADTAKKETKGLIDELADDLANLPFLPFLMNNPVWNIKINWPKPPDWLVPGAGAEALDGLLSKMNQVQIGLQSLADAIEKANKLQLHPLQTLGQGIATDLATAGQSISGWFGEKAADAKQFGIDFSGSLVSGMVDIGVGILGGLATGAGVISGWFNKELKEAQQSISNWKGSLSTTAAGVMASIAAAFSWTNIKNAARDALDSIKSFWQKHKEDVLKGAVTALGLGIVAAVLLWPGAISGALAAVFIAISGTFIKAKEAVAAETGETRQKVTEEWDAIKIYAEQKWSEILTAAEEKWEAIKTAVSTKMADLATAIGTKWDEVKTNTNTKWTEIKTAIGNKLGEIWSDVNIKAGNVANAAAKAWSGLLSNTNSIWKSIKDTIRTHVNGIIDIINNLIDKFNRLKFKVPKVTVMGKTYGGWTIKPIQIPNIPHLRTGGVFRKESLFVGGEGNRQEAVIPLSPTALEPFAEQIAMKMVQANASSYRPSSPEPSINVGTLIADELSLKQLARKMRRYMLEEDSRLYGREG